MHHELGILDCFYRRVIKLQNINLGGVTMLNSVSLIGRLLDKGDIHL